MRVLLAACLALAAAAHQASAGKMKNSVLKGFT